MGLIAVAGNVAWIIYDLMVLRLDYQPYGSEE